MKVFRNESLNIFFSGTIGFLIATFAGIFSSYLLFKLNLFRPLFQLIPEEQPLIRLYAGIVFTFLGAGIGGAINGLLRGFTLHTVDPQGSRRRYLLGSALAYGISSGVLLIPALLILSLLAQYNPGSPKDPFTFLFVFTLIGAIYGLISGLLLVLLTLRLRIIWLPWLASIVGTALGGTLLGAIIWRQGTFLMLPSRFLQTIVFLLFLGIALVGLTGSLISLAYRWVAKQRERGTSERVNPSRWQDSILLVASAALIVLMISVSGTLVDFITTHTGTTTTSLKLETQGVHWQTLTPIAESSNVEDESSFDLSANPQGTLAVVWTMKNEIASEIVYANNQVGLNNSTGWSPAVVVASSRDADLTTPQLVQDIDGYAHIIWAAKVGDESAIYYSRCQDDACSAPVAISGLGGAGCDQAPEPARNDWPAITITSDHILMVAWNAGGLLAYSSWSAGDLPPHGPVACFKPLAQNLQPQQWQPRLATWENGERFIVYSAREPEGDAPIGLVNLSSENIGTTTKLGEGGLAEVEFDRSGNLHLAWCSADGSLSYLPASGSIEKIEFPACRSRPRMFQDSLDRLHLIWYSDQVENNFSARLPGSMIYESFRATNGWSEPSIVTAVDQTATPSTAAAVDGTAFIAWHTSQGSRTVLLFARQIPYQCNPENLSPSGRIVLEAIRSGGFHPSGYQSPYCWNRFDGLIYMPNPKPEFSTQAATMNGGFDRLAEVIQNTQYELLISNMQWDQDQNGLSPGYRITEGVADLYHQLRANPTRYPRGLTVRILLGNYPNITTFQWGDQIWNVIDDLHKAGVEQMEDPSIGWKLEVANFRGTYPHSHTKFIVIDGKMLLTAGFNISWFHLPFDHPSGKGSNLTDLGILLTGPVAQEGLTVFDDMWTNANQLTCSDFMPGADLDTWRQSCVWKSAQSTHLPEVKQFYPTDQDQSSFALYRTDVYKEADTAYTTSLQSARSSIDVLQANFSAEFQCLLNIITPGTCTYANALPWMQAIVDSVEQNHTQVRAIVENANMNGLENRVGIDILNQELARRGLSEFVEIRFFNGRLHTKAALVDDELLFVGSQNFHYSSFGGSGLLEFVAATESLEAIRLYEEMFTYYWDLAVPADQATWGTSGG